MPGRRLRPQCPVGDGGAVPVLLVEDIPAKLAEIVGAGGLELMGKTEISGDHGFCAYFRDPCGNKMGLWSRA
jgi:predicted enzyme related to lactoylglutathione lyase